MTDSLKDFYSLSRSVVSSCRHQPTLLFSIDEGGIEIFGASDVHVTKDSVQTFDLIVNLQGYRKFKGDHLLNGPREWLFLRRFTDIPTVHELVLDWPDQGIFPVGRNFWEAFLDGLKRHQCKKVLLFCMGGHGRTGTAAGCLMTVSRDIQGGQAIREIRDHYCDKAIETKKQENYVRSMTRRVVKK